MTVCEICNGNGFYRDSGDVNALRQCPTCIEADISDLPVSTSRRSKILRTAAELVDGDRAKTHGDAASSFRMISTMWSTYLGKPVAPADVAAMMVMLKIVRAKHNPSNIDNWIDQCGYAALGGELGNDA